VKLTKDDELVCPKCRTRVGFITMDVQKQAPVSTDAISIDDQETQPDNPNWRCKCGTPFAIRSGSGWKVHSSRGWIE
jgi:hypothetical protein